MTRIYKRKTERGLFSREAMLEGVRLVLDGGQKIKPTARELNLNYKTLGRYVELKRRGGAPIENRQFGYSASRHSRIFNDEQEGLLASYLLQASRIYFGLTIKEFRTLAFEFASANDLKIPTSWKKIRWLEKNGPLVILNVIQSSHSGHQSRHPCPG